MTNPEVPASAETATSTQQMRITVRFWASAREAAGAAERLLDMPVSATIADLVAVLAVDDRLARVLGVCSVLVGEQPVAKSDRGSFRLSDGATVEFLPPFAGG